MADPDARYCTNCRAELPPRAASCPACGVFAGEVFDGRVPRAGRRGGGGTIAAFAALIAVAAGAWYLFAPVPTTPRHLAHGPVHVVRGRPGETEPPPGSKISEAEAIRVLRRSIESSNAADTPPSKCLVIMSQGFDAGGWTLEAYDGCKHQRDGRWRVDGRSRAVTRQR